MKRWLLLFAMWMMLTAETCTDPPPQSVVDDGAFQNWSGDSLTSWTLERGAIARIGTWNRYDTGVSLDGDDAAISQILFAGGVLTSATCFTIKLAANIDASVTAAVGIDLENVGVEATSFPLLTNGWAALTFPMDVAQSPIRLILRKTGAGRAWFADISVIADDSACGELIALHDAPVGSECQQDSECAGNKCTGAASPSDAPGGVCSDCSAGSCEAGQVCDVHWLGASAAFTCAERGDTLRGLGEGCSGNADCASGLCTAPVGVSVCGECVLSSASLSTSQCGFLYGISLVPILSVSQRPAGASCLSAGMCGSGTCTSPTGESICNQARTPCKENTDCPTAASGVQEYCDTTSIYRGTCR
jgi:hypothetical protein